MAHNIITSNDIDVNANAVMQTTTRPILVQYKYSPTDATPVPILVQIDVLVEENGTFSKVGSTQVSSKDFDSTASNTVFTFDISSILQSRISTGFYESIFTTNTVTQIDFKNTSSNNSYKSVIRYKTQARAWYLDSNNTLVLNESDSAVENPSNGSDERYACDVYFKDKELSPSKYVNLPVSAFVIANPTTDLGYSNFLTNCPLTFRRKIALGMPLSLSVLHLALGANITVKCQNTPFAGGNLNESCGHISLGSDNTASIHTKNLTLTNTYLFSQLTSTEANVTKKISFTLTNAGDANTNTPLLFEVMNNSTSTNAYLDRMKKEATSIYFVNDFGVLDYFTFDSNLDVVHEHTKTTFKTGFKDYTSRTSSKRGVGSGKTVEIHSCFSYVNRDVSEWLSEIYRSKEVYLYERDTSTFVPIIVLDGDTQPSFADKTSLQPFSISFIKDTHIIKR